MYYPLIILYYAGISYHPHSLLNLSLTSLQPFILAGFDFAAIAVVSHSLSLSLHLKFFSFIFFTC